MKLKEILKKQGFTDEQIANIENEMKNNQVYETTIENAENRVATLENEKTTLTTQLQTANTRITTLEKSKGQEENEDLKNTISEKDKIIENLQASIKQRDLYEELKEFGCKNPKAVEALLNNSKLDYKDNKHIGLEEQIKDIRESDSYLFIEESKPEPGGTGGAGGFRGNGNKGNDETQSIGARLGKAANESSAFVGENPYFK